MGRLTFSIGIVGGGIAGAATATALARDGHRVTVFERAPVLRPVGAGVLIQPSGQAALRRLGLIDEITAHAERVETLHARMAPACPGGIGRDLIKLRFDEVTPGTTAFGVHRSELFAPLHRAAENAGTRFVLATDITATRHRADRRVELLDQTGTAHGPFDLVIAADGARSVLRGDCGLTKIAWKYEPLAVWTTARCVAVRGKLLQVTRGSKKLCGLLSVGGGRCSLFWGLTGQAAKTRMIACGFDAWREECLALCPEAAEVFETIRSFDQLTITPFFHVWMPRWYSRRVLFLGDAAHAMSPHSGQGANLALMDAVTIADCLRSRRDVSSAARLFVRTRTPHVRLYAALSGVLTPFFQGRGFVKALGRNVALPLMTRLPWLRKRMVQTMTGLRPSISGW